MISRHLRILFWVLVFCIVVMAALLFSGRQRARHQVADLADRTPIDAPYTDTTPVTLLLANDQDGSIIASDRQIALPTEVTARARAILDHLVIEYSLPGSAHPLPPGAMVNEIFLLPLPIVGHTVDNSPHVSPLANGATPTRPVANTDPDALKPQNPGGELAIIDLRGSFVNSHPSGVEAENLTLLSILGTLHATVPEIEQVRFLVDGQPRETLAGHIDLLKTYPVRDTTQPPTP